jgi:Holliday junction DNA helicase RuvA
MIARLKGVVVDKNEQLLIVDVSGVGYEVNVTSQVADDSLMDQEVLLYTYDHIRENSRELFGFNEIESKKLFELLLKVNGVGPKMALSLMGLGEAKQIRSAIASGNVAFVSGASGVGKRLAERICVDLKDKVGIIAGQDVISVDDIDDDAVSALVALGYSRAQAATAIAKVDQKASVEDQIKQALKEIG